MGYERVMAMVACEEADLDQVGVPRIFRNAEVVIALLLYIVSTTWLCTELGDSTFFAPCPKTWPVCHSRSVQ